MIRSEFEHKIIQLRKIILDGISYYTVFQILDREYEDSIKDFRINKGLWWKYRGFLAPARNALMWSILMQLSKAYDTDERAISLRNLLIEARNNQSEVAQYTTQDSLENTQIMILEIKGILDKLKRYRNKRLVHYDSTEMEDIKIPAGDVNILIEKTKSIFNSLKLAFDGKADDFDDIMENVEIHTSQVISLLDK